MPSINVLKAPFNPLQRSIAETGGETYAALLLRNEVREIIGSYHHKFDHFYECIQNAVDSCEKAFGQATGQGTSVEYAPMIKVIIDLSSNCLTVIDNGIGMPKSVVLEYFFTPYATLKSDIDSGNTRQRGEKGVGATFLSYGTNFIHLTTLSRDTQELTSGQLVGGLDWSREKSNLLPMPTVEPSEPHDGIEDLDHGTAITIQFSTDSNISDLDEYGVEVRQWEAILRLHTALGYIDFNQNDEFLKVLRASISVVDKDGHASTDWLKIGFLYPHLATAANVQLSKLSRDKKGNLPESQRALNILWDVFSYDQVSNLITDRMENVSGLRPKKRESLSNILNLYRPEAYVAFAYGVDFWEERNHEIWGPDREGHLRHGIAFATKTQKIGEPMRIDFAFRSGDFNRFFVLLNMHNLKADIGRKSLAEGIGDFGNFFANSIQSKFTSEDDCLKPSPGAFDESQESELEQVKERAYSSESLNSSTLHLRKIPREEQDVVALFFELLGSGVIRGYEFYSTHISRTYDGVGRFFLKDLPENRYDPETNKLGIAVEKFKDGKVVSPTRCFIEFKYSTDGLVKDVRGGYKRLQDIKWLICWEVGERHKKEGIGVLDITEPAQVNRRDYYGVTHLMTEGQNKVYIICLKKLLEIAKP